VLRLRPLAFATFLVWRLRIGACGFWRLWQLPDKIALPIRDTTALCFDSVVLDRKLVTEFPPLRPWAKVHSRHRPMATSRQQETMWCVVHSENKSPVSGSFTPVLGVKLKRDWYVFWLFFKIDLCSATLMKSSRRDLSNDVGLGSILKNNQNSYDPRFSFTP